MRYLFTLSFILLCLNIAFSQSEYGIGYQEGFKKGYCYDESSGCIPPNKDTPEPDFGESFDSYKDGFGRGFKDGLNKIDARKSSTESSKNNSKSDYSNNSFSSSFHDVPLSMQDNIPEVDLKALEESLIPKAYDFERERKYNEIQSAWEDELNNLKNRLNSIGNSDEPYSNYNNGNIGYSGRNEIDATDDNQLHSNTNSNFKTKTNPVYVIFLLLLAIGFVVHKLYSNSRLTNKYMSKPQSNLSDNLFLMFITQYWGIFAITSVITHIWTVIIAFSEGGIISGLFTFVAPGISEIYWMIKMIGENNLFSLVAFVQLILSCLMLIIRKSNATRF